MIPNSSIDDIRNKSDIVQTISEYVPLKKRGKNYLGLCPFHSEKTPSFTVSPDKGIWHCFGCNEGGNVFAFLMKMENVSFFEAVETLGEKVGIKIEQKFDAEKASEKDRYIGIMDMAMKFYSQTLHDEGGPALEYIKKRDLSKDVVDRFMLGYAPDRWEALYEFLFRKGVTAKDMLTVGLVIERKDKTGYYDRFRNRLMFPIFNIRGKTIGFSGRTLSASEEAKYVNSPDSPIYNKGYTLYGINVAKDAIKQEDFAILVEGNIDLLTCHQFGLKNAVAPLGTAFTAYQAKLLTRFTKNVIIVFDNDPAGSTAAVRSAQILRDSEISVFVANVSGGKDPDEVIRKKGVKYFAEDLKKAKPWTEYNMETILSKYNLKLIEDKSSAVKEATRALAAEKDPIIKKEYIKLLSDRTGIDPATVEAEVKRQDFYLGRSGQGSSSAARSVEKPGSKLLKAEESLIKSVIDDPSIIPRFKELMHWREFTNTAHRTIAEMIQSFDPASLKGDLPHSIMESLPGDEEKKLLSRILVTELPSGNKEKMFGDFIKTIKAYHLKSKLDDYRVEIGNAEKIKDYDKVTELHRKFNECSSLYRELEKVI